ncbi:cell death activator CIDE-3-like [Scleropages formosus]|uniref:Cell death activator CIDE-3-like n=1 Tax=Scleropages formosus TaxID=113540 RepID=A0A0P7U8G3_SCLFO|nr:cell death activator CIDE-3 [Scleropages formosus]KPP63927.1 cell death activator CIDE-3-like [Scleropages formosus]
MEYAKKSLSLLTPTSLSKCVTASATMTQQLFTGRTPRPKPFRVSNADRSVKKGIMADGLHDLLEKATAVLDASCVSSVVLDEDGTGVDTEDFFHTLQDNTVLMLLEKGQKWTPPQTGTQQVFSGNHRLRRDVARLTFDLYKNNPEEFIGCLNVKATLYGVYSLSYDLRCYRAKTMIKEMLRWTLFSMQATGHVLLGTSGYMQQLLDEEEVAEKEVGRLRGTVRKTMQSIEWRKTRC